jgi:hypothetical protein
MANLAHDERLTWIYGSKTNTELEARYNQWADLYDKDVEDVVYDATICVGTLTVGHAPPSSLDEFVRVTKVGGLVVFGMRPDHYETGGFKQKQDFLEGEGRWKLVSRSAPYPIMPTTEPELMYETWIYEVLV